MIQVILKLQIIALQVQRVRTRLHLIGAVLLLPATKAVLLRALPQAAREAAVTPAEVIPEVRTAAARLTAAAVADITEVDTDRLTYHEKDFHTHRHHHRDVPCGAGAVDV